MRALRDRHYSCRRPGGLTAGPPGLVVVLRSEVGDAAWISHWPDPRYVMHGFGNAWVCTLFRNESEVLSSLLVTEAVAATRYAWAGPAPDGFLTFIDPDKVRRKRDPGRCFRKAGWVEIGRTKDRDLVVLWLAPALHQEPVEAPAVEPTRRVRMVKRLTLAQRNVLDALVELAADGWPASVRELGRAAGLASPSTVHAHLVNLEAAGYVARHPRLQRGGWRPTVACAGLQAPVVLRAVEASGLTQTRGVAA